MWNGQQSLSGQRKSAFALAQQLYEEPFKPYGKNYDPIFPYGKSDGSNDQVDNKVSSGRPSWTLFARLHEKAETILFREKFLDWPDPTKIIRMKGHPSTLELAPAVCTVKLLAKISQISVDVICCTHLRTKLRLFPLTLYSPSVTYRFYSV